MSTHAHRHTTLVGRMALLQVALTVGALAAVVGLSHLAMTEILRREWDSGLEAANRVVAHELQEEQGRASAELSEDIGDHLPAGVLLEVRDPAGVLVFVRRKGGPLASTGGGCATQGEFRVCELRAQGWQLLAGRSRAPGLALRNRFVRSTGLVALLVALTLGLVTRTITGRALAPVSRMAARIASLRPGTGQRVELDPRFAELQTLAGAFDDLLARMDEALARERRFAAEASHELKTPLTVLRGEVEALAAGEGAGGPAGRALGSVDALIGLVEALLWLSRAQAPLPREALELVNLADVVRKQATEAAGGRHAGRKLELSAPDELLVDGDERLLARAVANLIDNALKYSPPPKPVVLRLRADDGQALLEVQDQGPGIDAALESRVFEPFFRGGPARAATTGFGLGLPLARAVARAHRGDVRVASSSPAGSCFQLLLPLGAAPGAVGSN